MRLFVVKTLYFFIPIICITFLLDKTMSYFLKQKKEYPGEFEVWNDIYNSTINCDLAVYGSSRAWVHINPKILSDSLNQSVYNFGVDGHNFWIQYLRHLEFIKYNKAPKTILVSLDMFSLQKRTELYQLEQFLPYMLWNKNIRMYTRSFIGFNLLEYYIPFLRYSGKSNSIKSIIELFIYKQSVQNYRNLGYLGMDLKWNSDLETAKSNSDFYKVEIDSGSVLLFNKFILDCKREGINIILVYTPEYIEGQNFVLNRREVFNLFESFSRKHAINFFDYSQDSICFNKKYFYNSSHLNAYGSMVFSKKLAHDLKKLSL